MTIKLFRGMIPPSILHQIVLNFTRFEAFQQTHESEESAMYGLHLSPADFLPPISKALFARGSPHPGEGWRRLAVE
jgi:hypothetical protein